ncbi:hypothetical protein M0R45_024901 [Rubus argutus]|uniref:Uncharacterized protein n=1 Tax=Rubus argutus TaxID=59490 RepID=A0AAW1WTV5_RUBAR
MSMVKLSTLLLIFGFSFSLLATNSHSQVHFDFYQFVVWYAPGMCIGVGFCANDLPESWTIHGLWPSIDSTTNMEISCEKHAQQLGITFTESKIDVKDLVVMEQVWPNLQNVENENLWKHEYEKHGTCTLPDPAYPDWDDALTAYFRAAVNIFTDPHTNVSNALTYNNIVPGSQTSEV